MFSLLFFELFCSCLMLFLLTIFLQNNRLVLRILRYIEKSNDHLVFGTLFQKVGQFQGWVASRTKSSMSSRLRSTCTGNPCSPSWSNTNICLGDSTPVLVFNSTSLHWLFRNTIRSGTPVTVLIHLKVNPLFSVTLLTKYFSISFSSILVDLR